MGIAALYNIPGVAEEFNEWTFAHAVHHFDIIEAIYHRLNIALPSYILDPFDPQNPDAAETWAYQHQIMHNNQNRILGISGFDLAEVKWQDPNERAAWIQLNATEHLQAGNILQIASGPPR